MREQASFYDLQNTVFWLVIPFDVLDFHRRMKVGVESSGAFVTYVFGAAAVYGAVAALVL